MMQSHKRNIRLHALVLALLIALTGILPAFAEPVAESYVVTTIGGVSLRETPYSTAEVLYSLPEGTVLPVLESENGWYYVLYQADFGFIARDYTRAASQGEIDAYLAAAGTEPVYPAYEAEPADTGDEAPAEEDAWLYEAAAAEEEQPDEVILISPDEYTVLETAPQAEEEEPQAAAQADQETEDWVLSTLDVDFEETVDPVIARVNTPQGGTLTLREDKSTKARALVYLPNGTEVYLLDADPTWAMVMYEDVTGYVLADYLEVVTQQAEEELPQAAAEEAPAAEDKPAEPAGEDPAAQEETVYCVTVKTGGAPLEMKATPSMDGAVAARIPDESELVVLGQDGYFYATIYGGITGYVSMDMVEIDFSLTAKVPYVYVVTDMVNVRLEPQRSANASGHAKQGEVLQMWASPYTNDGYTWYPVIVNGIEGYLRGDTCMMLSRNQLNNYQVRGILPSQTDLEKSGYLMCVSRSVNVRAAVATTARSLGKLEEGDVLRWEDQIEVSGDTWYRVDYHDMTAFVMSQYVKVLTNEEYAMWQTSNLLPEEQTIVQPETAEQTADEAAAPTSNLAYTVKNRVLVRKDPSTMSVAVTRIEKSDTFVTLLGDTRKDDNGKDDWYLIEYGTYNGWVRGDMLHIYTEEELNGIYVENGVAPAGSDETPRTPDIVIPENDDSAPIDVAFTTRDRVYLRSAPNVQAPSVGIVGLEHTYLTVLSDAMLDESGANYAWYQVQYNNVTGYVRGDLIHLMTEDMWKATFGTDYEQESTVLAPQEEEQPVYADDLDDWEAPAAETATPEPAPAAPPAAVPAAPAANETDTAYTLEDSVLVRKSPAMSSTTVIRISGAGTYIQLMSGPVADSDGAAYTWYLVEYAMQTGYVRSDMLHVLTNEEWDQQFNQQEDYTDYSLDGGVIVPEAEDPESGLAPYVTYSTLRQGSTGESVTQLQQALFEQGYLSAEDVTGEYTTATMQAVITFQMDHSLTADGIAGQMTQSALYGTKSYDATLYPVEKSNWYTGTIQHVWTKGTVAVITDVYTGLSFRARRLGGGYHADVEPLTAADSAVMCQIYGVSSTEDILSNKHWQRRPLWVTVGGHTYAASMYGVPHNYPDGDSIPDNNFSGQFCVHFVNSRVHRTGDVDAYHQQAIQYAYTHAPERKTKK